MNLTKAVNFYTGVHTETIPISASISPVGVVITVLSTVNNSIRLESLKADGATWANIETEAGTSFDTNAAVDPTLVYGVVCDGANVRLRNNSALNPYALKYLYWKVQ